MKSGDYLNDNTEGFFVRGELVRFKDRLKEAMGGESNRAFGARCQLSEAVIRNYLSGKTYPTLDRLAVIAGVTGRPIEWFLSDETEGSANLKTQKDESELQEQLLSVLRLMNAEEIKRAIDIFKIRGLSGLMPDVIGQAIGNPAHKEILEQRGQPERTQAEGQNVGPQRKKKAS